MRRRASNIYAWEERDKSLASTCALDFARVSHLRKYGHDPAQSRESLTRGPGLLRPGEINCRCNGHGRQLNFKYLRMRSLASASLLRVYERAMEVNATASERAR